MNQTNKEITVHKSRAYSRLPKISLILLDWSCRERFFALDWLAQQDADREEYEIIWVELFDRAVPEVIEKADVVITCGQKGRYHKHIGYNVGLLHATGEVITVCDSDAVFPPNFISSIKKKFGMDRDGKERSLVLMHYERRTKSAYPDGMAHISELHQHEWVPLWENVGACVTMRRDDSIRLGGFDEHKTFRGYVCGPYELAWRAVNAGIPEEWHEPDVTLWHFAHPNEDHTNIYRRIRWQTLLELGFVRPHLKEHSLSAVEAFSTGRLLPLRENPKVHALRMSNRRIGSEYEMQYAQQTSAAGFTTYDMLFIRWLHFENFILNFLDKRAGALFRGYSYLANGLYPESVRARRLKTLGTAGILCAAAENQANVLHDDGMTERHRRMDILFLSDDDLTKSVVYDIHVMAEGLSRLGHNICVVDCKRDKPKWFGSVEQNMARVYPDAKVRMFRYTMWTFPIFASGFCSFVFKFIYAYIKCYRLAKKVVKQENIDIIVSYSVVNSGITAIKLSRKKNIPVVFRNIDMLHRLNASALIRNIVAFFELIVYPRMDRILALTPRYADYLTIMGAESAKLEQLPFPVEIPKQDVPRASIDDRIESVCKSWQTKKRQIIGFVGHFYTFSGLPDLIREFPRIVKECPNARLLLVGDGPIRGELESIVSQLQLQDYVLITGLQPFESLPHFIGMSAVCINIYPIKGDMKDLFAAKVIQYLACGKPTVSSALPGMTSMIAGEDCGVVYVDDAAEMASAIVSLLRDRGERMKLAKAGLEYVHRVHARDEVVRRLEAILANCIENRTKAADKGGLIKRWVARIRSRSYDNELYDSANDGYVFSRAGQRVDRVARGATIRRVMLFMDKMGEPTGQGTCFVRRVNDDSLVGSLGTIDVSKLPKAPADPKWILFDTNEVKIPKKGDYRIVFEWDPKSGDEANYPRVRYNNANTIRGSFTQFGADSRWVDQQDSDSSIHVVLER